MSPPVFFGFLTFAIGVPFLSIAGATMFKQWLAYKQAMLATLSQQTAEKAAQYAAKTERLEQRVAVLERILTDRSAQLGEEIERLRDTPVN